MIFWRKFYEFYARELNSALTYNEKRLTFPFCKKQRVRVTTVASLEHATDQRLGRAVILHFSDELHYLRGNP